MDSKEHVGIWAMVDGKFHFAHAYSIDDSKQISRIEPTLDDYSEEFRALIDRAVQNQMPRHRFEQAIGEAVAAVILALFLRGVRKQGQGSLTIGEQVAVTSQIRRQQDAIAGLAHDIFDLDRYDAPAVLGGAEGGISRAYRRVQLWVNSAASVFFLGETYRPNNPWLRWTLGPTEHCSTCLRLSGQVHTASEWRASGWYPRSSELECTGLHCQCHWADVGGPSNGAF